MNRVIKKRRKTDWMKIKVGAGIASIVAALAVFFILLHMEKSMLEQYEKAMVYVAATEIPRGELIGDDNIVRYFEHMELETRNIPETALQTVEELYGLVAVYDVEKGVVLTRGMFESVNEITAEMSSPVIAGFKADDLYQIVGGVLRSGDRIHLIQVTEEGAKLLWENIYVQSVFDQSGEEITNEDTDTAAQRVNVYLDKEDVEGFYATLTTGNVRVVKVCK